MNSNEAIQEGRSRRKFDTVWLAGCFAVTAIAALVRFLWLGMKPFHHDEGVNGWFLTTLVREGTYRYDPANYHGPTLYYISLAFAELFGLETISVRSSVAVFGVLTVVLVFFLRDQIGRTGSLAAGLFLALSPGMVYISRYFIHEMFFIFASLGFAISVVYFISRRKAGPFAIAWLALILLVCFLPSTLNLASLIAGRDGAGLWAIRAGLFLVEFGLVFFVIRMLVNWDEGRPIYILLAVACASLLFATKETAFITLGTMAIACLCVWIWSRIRQPQLPQNEADDEIRDSDLNWKNFAAAIGTGSDRILIAAAAIVIFAYIGVLFFSSFFSYSEGVQKAFEAYSIWTKTGNKDHTQNGFWAYLRWVFETEAPIFVAAAIGAAIAFFKARHRFAMFAGLWAFGLFAAYTIIPYKTPWLAVNFLLPMCIAGGYGVNELASASGRWFKTGAIAFTLVLASVLAYQMYDHNFVRPADEDTVYAYAHTEAEFLDMVDEIKRYAEKSGKGREASIEIVSPDYWPLVWYLKDYPKAIFQGRLVDTRTADVIVAKKRDQDAEVMRRYAANYLYVGSYGLRSGVELNLLVRRDLAGDEGKELYKILEEK